MLPRKKTVTSELSQPRGTGCLVALPTPLTHLMCSGGWVGRCTFSLVCSTVGIVLLGTAPRLAGVAGRSCTHFKSNLVNNPEMVIYSTKKLKSNLVIKKGVAGECQQYKDCSRGVENPRQSHAHFKSSASRIDRLGHEWQRSGPGSAPLQRSQIRSVEETDSGYTSLEEIGVVIAYRWWW